MAKYREAWEDITSKNIIAYIDKHSNTRIPVDPTNSLYQDFLIWQSAGGVADPMYTQAEIDAILAAQTTLETTRTAAHNEINLGVLAGKTYQQVENYIDNQVTNLASAKAFLKKMARIVLAIIKRLQLEE